MKKLFLFLLVFFLALFVFNSQASACNSKPKIYSVVQDPETGDVLISGKHLKNPRVKLGGANLEILESTHNEIRAGLPVDFVPGSYRLQVYKRIKRRWRRYYWASTHMDITIGATGQQRQPGSQDPPGDVGDTTPPDLANTSWPTGSLGFLETSALISFDVKDDNEVAFIGIQNVALPHKSKTVSAEPGVPSMSISEEIPTIPGDNTILIWAVDMFGNVAKEMATVTRERNCVDCKLRALHMGGADFYGAVLTAADLRDADLSNANLSMAELGGATLNAANLTNANLYGVKMADANLKFTDLSGVDLRDATLSADMMGANLSGADMRGAHFGDANLAYADLRGANLAGATMRGTSGLDQAIFANTICPDGSNSDENDNDRFTCANNLSF